jgi:hypothetical protein
VHSNGFGGTLKNSAIIRYTTNSRDITTLPTSILTQQLVFRSSCKREHAYDFTPCTELLCRNHIPKKRSIYERVKPYALVVSVNRYALAYENGLSSSITRYGSVIGKDVHLHPSSTHMRSTACKTAGISGGCSRCSGIRA